MSTAKFNRSKADGIRIPEVSYFALKPRSLGTPDVDTPSESRATTPFSEEKVQLLTPGSKPSRFKLPSKAGALSLRSTKASAGHTRLQAKWLDTHKEKGGDLGSPSVGDSVVAAPDYDAAVLNLTDDRRGSEFSDLSSVADGRRPSVISEDGSLLIYNRRPSGLSAFQADGALPPRIETISEGADLPGAVDEEKIAPRPVVAKDYALLLPPVELVRRGSSDRFADRLRRSSGNLSRSPSSLSLSALPSPRSPLASNAARSALASPSTPNLTGAAYLAVTPTVGTPGEETPFANPWSRRASRTGKHLDEAINFDRIRSPALSPSASLTDLPRARELDAFRPNAQPYAAASIHSPRPPLANRSSSSSVRSTASSDVEDEDDFGLGPPPEVPPALEYVDPEIECVAPNASTVTLPQAEALALESAITHPWVEPPFNIVQRKQPTINKYTAAFKIVVSLSAVSSLLIGYGLGVKIVSVGPWSFGMYGLILIVDFVTQTIAASFNRRRVNKLTEKSPLVKGVAERMAAKDAQLPTTQPAPLPECSIAVVGYREDEEAWVACLKSLQAQQYPIKHIIGVVDGNDGPDLDMANAFGKAFPEEERLIVHLPVLLSVMYKEKYWEHISSLDHKPLTRWEYFKMWLTNAPRPGQHEAHEVAWNYMLNYVHQQAEEGRWKDWKGICFSQPHGHKRHAMFTAFVVGAYALGTKDAMLTTDSDTYVYPEAVKNMMALLFSDEKYAGVTGDVRIWNKSDSFLALMSSIRYWFAFNVERACQSAFGCVGCLSGPLGLYKTSDLISVLSPWILQTFLGKETTFGDDRHLSNRILSLGHKTGYTHLAMCDSDTPAGYVRWVKQQTRWSKSFFREAFWFPKSFAYHDFWLTVETSKQFLYPFVLTATVLRMLYNPTSWVRPLIWLATMFGVAVIKSIYGVICLRDPRQFLFGIYGFMYFFGLLPSKLFACFTVHITNWGTSARSKSEFARPESFLSRTTHVGHLVVWYMSLSLGLAYLLATVFHSPIYWLAGSVGVGLSGQAYSDVIVGETKYHYYVLRKRYRAWRASKATVTDEERITGKPIRGAFKRLRRGNRTSNKVETQPEINQVTLEVPAVTVDEEPTTIVFDAPVTPAEPENAHVNIPAVLPTADSRYTEVDPLVPAPVSADLPSFSIDEVEYVDPADMPAPEFGDDRKASVATTATAASYDSVRTPTGSTDDLGNLGYRPEVLVSPFSKASKSQSAGQASKAFNIASELSKRLVGRLGAIEEIPMSSKGGEKQLRVEGDDLDVIEEYPITPGAMTVY
ncbi:glycosyltransferase family 2 protein [Daedalea quercina L-15889]|uniref:Glycosyltransferase family 2 protein n=1 Tax=Daedalea quercina L-15889 TaxID=1314783 RepID=A0A165PE06_9APHY|nr:glycosyltransferase family 2 protein [Daedalea quercina L-15889]